MNFYKFYAEREWWDIVWDITFLKINEEKKNMKMNWVPGLFDWLI